MDYRLSCLELEDRLDIMRQGIAYRKKREEAILNLLAYLADMKVHEAGSHNGRMTEYVRILTRILRDNPRPGYELAWNEAEDIINATMLHDVGKIAIPDSILLKPGRLTVEELEIVKQHPAIGVDLLNALIVKLGEDSLLSVALQIAGNHHEKWNGEGYPARLKGTEIPLSARIVALTDVYDALAHARPYKEAFSHERTMNIILYESPGHFDPYLLEVFREHQMEFKACDLLVTC